MSIGDRPTFTLKEWPYAKEEDEGRG